MLRKSEDADHNQVDRHDVVEQSRHNQNKIPAINATSGLSTWTPRFIVLRPCGYLPDFGDQAQLSIIH
jgi:hypothetical protein